MLFQLLVRTRGRKSENWTSFAIINIEIVLATTKIREKSHCSAQPQNNMKMKH